MINDKISDNQVDNFIEILIEQKNELLIYLKNKDYIYANLITRAACEVNIIENKLKNKEKTISLLCYFYKREENNEELIFDLIKKNKGISDLIYMILVILKDNIFDENIRNYIKENVDFNSKCLSLLERNWLSDDNTIDSISEKSFGKDRSDSLSSSSISTKTSFSSINSSTGNLLKSIKSNEDILIDDENDTFILIDNMCVLFFKYMDKYKKNLEEFYANFINSNNLEQILEDNKEKIKPLIDEKDINCLEDSLKYSLLVLFLLSTNINFPLINLKKIILCYWDEDIEDKFDCILSDLCNNINKLWSSILEYGPKILRDKLEILDSLVDDNRYIDFI